MLHVLSWLSVCALADPPAYEQIPGRWYPNTYRSPDLSGLTEAQRDEVAALESLGYLGGYEAHSGSSGVVRWDNLQADNGYNLYSSGHDATALLVSMDGRVLHRWQKPFEEAFPGFTSTNLRDSGAWRRVALRPEDGHLLAIYEGIGIVHLDANSRVVWASRNRAHHEARWLPDGRVLTLTRALHPEGPGGHPVLEDFVSLLDATGQEIRRVSVLAALLRSPWAHLLQRAPTDTGDVLHTNSIFPLDGRPGPEGPGDGQVLLSLRHLSALIVLDLDEERILWAATGDWSRQHDVELTRSGALMLFDNRGGPSETSRVSLLAPWSLTPLWRYSGPKGAPLRSEVLGAAQELRNGNLLVTESTRGRALEVTRQGSLVWEYLNPETTGPNGAYRAAIFEMIRLEADLPLPWLP